MLFHEARKCLGEMRQQFGHAVRGDYGASLRTQELEGLLNRERSQFQSSAAVFTQETQQEFEFAELRDRANRIRLEASEAIAAKDNQQSHERELKSDEAMKLKQRNDLLISELSFAQHDAIQDRNLIHSEQRALDTGRRMVTEKELVVRNSTGEMSVVESYLNLAVRMKDYKPGLKIDKGMNNDCHCLCPIQNQKNLVSTL